MRQELTIYIPNDADREFLRIIKSMSDVGSLTELDGKLILNAGFENGSLADLLIARLNERFGLNRYGYGVNEAVLKQFLLLDKNYPILVFDWLTNNQDETD